MGRFHHKNGGFCFGMDPSISETTLLETWGSSENHRLKRCLSKGDMFAPWELTFLMEADPICFFGPVNCTSLLIATWQHLIRFQHPNKPHDPMMDPIYSTTFYGIL